MLFSSKLLIFDNELFLTKKSSTGFGRDLNTISSYHTRLMLLFGSMVREHAILAGKLQLPCHHFFSIQ